MAFNLAFMLSSRLSSSQQLQVERQALIPQAVMRHIPRVGTIVTLLFSSFCLTGFTVQVYYIAQRYFEYSTATATKILLPNLVNASSVSLCIRYVDLMPLSDGRPAYTLSNTQFSQRSRNITSSLTIAEIMSATPASHLLLLRCLYRKPHTYQVFEGSRDQCQQLFPATKYFMMQSVCYAFFAANASLKQPFVYKNLAFSLR